MDDRKQQKTPSQEGYEGLDEATAGWDPYISDLLTDPRKVFREERRREPRDRKPSRRRARLIQDTERNDSR